MTWSEGSEGLKAGVGGGVGDQWQYYLSYEAEMKKPWFKAASVGMEKKG